MSYNKRILSEIDRELRDPYRSKRYSKSLAATNSLFAVNDLFAKPSRRRIYNPNAQYFQDGGTSESTLPSEYLKSQGFVDAVNQDLSSLFQQGPTDGYDSHWYEGKAKEYGVTPEQLREFSYSHDPDANFINAAAYAKAMNELAVNAGGKRAINIPFADNPIVLRTSADDIPVKPDYVKPDTLQEQGYIDATGTNAVNQDQSYSTGLAKRYGRNTYDNLLEEQDGGPVVKYKINTLFSNPPKYQIVDIETGKSVGVYKDKTIAEFTLERLNGGPSKNIDIDPGFTPKDSGRPSGRQIDPGFNLKPDNDIEYFQGGGPLKAIARNSKKILNKKDLDVIKNAAKDYKKYAIRQSDITVPAIKKVQRRLLEAADPRSRTIMPGVELTPDGKILKIITDKRIQGSPERTFNILKQEDEERLQAFTKDLKEEADLLKRSTESYLENPYAIDLNRGDSLQFDKDGFLIEPLGGFYHGVGKTSPGFNLETIEFDRSKIDPATMKDWTSTGSKAGNSRSEYGFFGALNKNQGSQAALKYDGTRERAVMDFLKDPSKRPANLGTIKEIGLSNNARLVGGKSPYVINALKDVGINATEMSQGVHIGGKMGMTPQKAAMLKSKYGIDGIIDLGGDELVILNPDVISSVSDVPFKLFDYTNPLVQSMRQSGSTARGMENILQNQFGSSYIHSNINQPYIPADHSWGVKGADKLGSMMDNTNAYNAREILQIPNSYFRAGLRNPYRYGDVSLPIGLPFSEKWWKAAEPNLDLIKQRGGPIELELNDKEIQKYVDDGYIVEDLPKAQIGKEIKPISKTIKNISKKIKKDTKLITDAQPNIKKLAADIVGGKIHRTLDATNRTIRDLRGGDRSLSEIVPITSGQKKIADIKANLAKQEGVNWLDSYLYETDPQLGKILRKDISDKILDIYEFSGPQNRLDKYFAQEFRGGGGDGFEGWGRLGLGEDVTGTGLDNTLIYSGSKAGLNLENPLVQTSNILRPEGLRNITSNKSLNDEEKTSLIRNYLANDTGGVNYPNLNLSVTNPGVGFYRYPDGTISDIALHEATHTAQRLGMPNRGFGEVLAMPDKGYYYPNENTNIGRFFKEVMPDKDWLGSPNELHSELMVARKKLFDGWVNDPSVKEAFKLDPNTGRTLGIPERDAKIKEWALNELRNPTNTTLDGLLETSGSSVPSLNKFFKKGVSREKKYQALRYLPGLAVPFVLPSLMDDNDKPKLQKGGALELGDEVTEDMIEELRRQGYTIEEI